MSRAIDDLKHEHDAILSASLAEGEVPSLSDQDVERVPPSSCGGWLPPI